MIVMSGFDNRMDNDQFAKDSRRIAEILETDFQERELAYGKGQDGSEKWRNEANTLYVVRVDPFRTAYFFIEPYLPYQDVDKNTMRLDAYYPASNRVYQFSSNLGARLLQQMPDYDIVCSSDNNLDALSTDNNCEQYEISYSPDLDLKAVLYQTGKFVCGRNTLLYRGEFGSRFAIGSLVLTRKTGTLLPSPLPLPKCVETCLGCGACEKACPTGAISRGQFHADLCLRQHMNTTGFTKDDIAEKVENRLVGCDRCQRVCPLNCGNEREMPRELLEFLRIDHMLTCLNKRSLAALSPYIGANYIRPQRILSLAINAAGNSGEERYIPQVQAYLDSPVEGIRINAERAYCKLTRR